ncbi:MAG: hypothetical protein MI863_22295 [Desulfobacterales bacterium]|nr:hypothetical protein [Desulfobacterales bacterium]
MTPKDNETAPDYNIDRLLENTGIKPMTAGDRICDSVYTFPCPDAGNRG